jgi:hypothetical protein
VTLYELDLALGEVNDLGRDVIVKFQDENGVWRGIRPVSVKAWNEIPSALVEIVGDLI